MTVRSLISAIGLGRLLPPPRSGAGPMADSRAAGKSRPIHLVIAASAFLIAIIVVAVSVLLSDLRRDEIDKSKRDIESLALVLASQIDRSFQSIALIQDGLIERIKNRGIVSTDDFTRQMSGYDTFERLKDQVKALPFIDAIVLTGADGRLVNFSRRWPIPPIHNINAKRDRIFKNSDVKFFVGDATRSPANQEWVLPLVRKISGPNGAFLGAVLGVMRLQYFERLFGTVAREGDRSISLFTSDGVLVARYPRDEALRGKSFAHREVFKNYLSRGQHGTVEQTSVTSEKSLLISGRNLPNYPLAVVVTRRVDDILAGWRYAALYVGAGAFVIALMIGGVAFLVIRQIGRSIRAEHHQLDAALNNMSQGLSMFDASARLVVCNSRYIEMFNMPHDVVKPGVSLQELVSLRIASGTFTKGAIANTEDFVDGVQEKAKIGVPTNFTHELTDGRVIAVVNHPLPDGGWVATHDDITEARRREESFRLLFDRSPVPMWVFDRESLQFLAVNDAAVALYGYSREQFMSMTVLELRSHEERDRFRRFLSSLPDSQLEANTGKHVCSDGAVIDVSIYSRTLTYSGRKARLTTVYDITKAKRVEEKLRRAEKFLDAIVENVPVPILVKDVSGAVNNASECRYTLVNRAFEELFGASRKTIIGKSVAELYPKERADFILAENNETLRSQQPITISDHAVHTKSNGVRIATGTSVAIRDDFNNPQYLITVLQDVTDRKRAEQRFARMAHYDDLTDLPNRATFNDAMEVALETAAKTRQSFAVLSLDLDGFKEANDTYGHAIGDALLCEVGRRLQVAGGGAFVARLGGDEFAIIDSSAGQPEAAAMLADEVLQALREDIVIEGRVIPVGATIGGAIYPADGKDAKSLMANADVALYRAKAEARGALLLYDAEMGEVLRERRALQDELRAAIPRAELLLHYQPQKKMSGKTVGFEALVRWQSARRGMVMPGVFIPVAEETGLIAPIGEWVLREACREAASWPEPLTIAVNISPVQFRHDDLPGLVHSILLETGLPPGRLELEITEGVLIEDYSHAMAVLTRLKALGVLIALDDFGTGYSSLSYLHAFPFDKIKIDRAFVGDLDRNHHSIAIVRAVIDLGHSLDIPILAEGVENAEQHALLFRKGCDEVQGYFTGRPRPIEDYAGLIGRGDAAPEGQALAG